MEPTIQPDQPGVKPAVQVPAGWTKEKDAESFVRNYHPEGSDLYAAAIERIAFEREELERLLAELIGDFCETSEAAFNLAHLCLSSKAKGDVLMSIIRNISSDERLLRRVEEDLLRVREAFDLCDTIISRYVLEGQKVLLLDLGAVIDDLCRVSWRLRESIRHAFKLQPRAKQTPQAVGSSN